jgi:hypothetical protein
MATYSEVTINDILSQENILEFNSLSLGQINEKENIITKLTKILNTFGSLEKFYESKKWVLNQLCLIFLYDQDLCDFGMAKEYIHQNLTTITQHSKITINKNDEAINKIVQKENFDGLTNYDQISLKFLLGIYVDYLIKTKDFKKAENIIKLNIQVNEMLGDIYGQGLALSRKASVLLGLKVLSEEVNDSYKYAINCYLKVLRNQTGGATYNIALNLIQWNKFLVEKKVDKTDFNHLKKEVKSNKLFDIERIIGDEIVKTNISDVLRSD